MSKKEKKGYKQSRKNTEQIVPIKGATGKLRKKAGARVVDNKQIQKSKNEDKTRKGLSTFIANTAKVSESLSFQLILVLLCMLTINVVLIKTNNRMERRTTKDWGRLKEQLSVLLKMTRYGSQKNQERNEYCGEARISLLLFAAKMLSAVK